MKDIQKKDFINEKTLKVCYIYQVELNDDETLKRVFIIDMMRMVIWLGNIVMLTLLPIKSLMVNGLHMQGKSKAKRIQ